MRYDSDGAPQAFTSDFFHFARILVYLCVIGILLLVLFLMLSIFRISSFTFNTYDSYQKIPQNKVGLLLGTSSLTAPGQNNEYFTYRIMAAAELFQEGKIKYILVSGDNRHESYNEPRQMYRALIKAGIPADRIVMDFAGISTLDSVVRARQVFMLQEVTVISQGFQNERALFIADHFGLKAIGFNAAEPESGFASYKIKIRELFARIKCVLDIYFLKTQPKFLGEPISIGDTPLPKMASNKPRRPTSKPKKPGPSVAALQEIAEYEALKQIAKQPTDSANYIKETEMAHQQEETALENQVESMQEQLLKDEQAEALRNAAQVAENSVSQGENTYIDPNAEEARQQELRQDVAQDDSPMVEPETAAADETAAQGEPAAENATAAPSEPAAQNGTATEDQPAAAPQSAPEAAPEPAPRPVYRRRVPRDDIVFHGDPWDYR